jgi:sugar fermentation stimulation protein A
LINAKKKGFRSILAFVIQMDGVTEVRANVDTHPEFGTALDDAIKAGVEIWFLACHVEPDSLKIIGKSEKE